MFFTLILLSCGISELVKPGTAESYSIDNIRFSFIHVPAGSTPSGLDDMQELTVEKSFLLGETEVTNSLAAIVFTWASAAGKKGFEIDVENGNTITYYGQRLMDLSSPHCHIYYNGTKFVSKNNLENHPVIEISWYGAVMLCNWLSEIIYNDDSNNYYSGMGPGWNHDSVTINKTKKGFRLPAASEWELAARYICPVHRLPGTHASGDISGSCYIAKTLSPEQLAESDVFGNFAWFEANSGGVGSSRISNNRGTHPVASAGSETGIPFSGKSNHLGIYDMSGNVWEWCFDKYYMMRIIKGGCWYATRAYLRVGFWENFSPSYDGTLVGFRLAKSI